MTKELYLKLEEIAQLADNIIDYREAITEISRHDVPTQDLLDGLIHVVIAKEKAWLELEQREDFKGTFNSRLDARAAYLKWSLKKAKADLDIEPF